MLSFVSFYSYFHVYSWNCLFIEFIFINSYSLLYRVIHIDDDSAVEYDCTENFLTYDYCIHIMSRTPTMSEEKLQQLLTFAGNFIFIWLAKLFI